MYFTWIFALSKCAEVQERAGKLYIRILKLYIARFKEFPQHIDFVLLHKQSQVSIRLLKLLELAELLKSLDGFYFAMSILIFADSHQARIFFNMSSRQVTCPCVGH